MRTHNQQLDAAPGLRAEEVASQGALSSESTYQVSYQQEAVFRACDGKAADGSQNLSAWCRLPADLVLRHLRLALDLVVQRHPTLRTGYAATESGCTPMALSSAPCDLTLIDARQWNPELLLARTTADGQIPFDLRRGPVFRAHLYSISDREHYVLLSVHPIAADVRSLLILLKELRLLYHSLAQDGAPSLKPPQSSYGEHVRRERDLVTHENYRESLDFWQRELSTDATVLDLPLDHPRVADRKTHRQHEVPFSLPSSLVQKLAGLAKEQSVSLPSVYLAAYALLLSRYGNNPDVRIALSASNRPAEMNEVVGNFNNPAVLQTACVPDLTFQQLAVSVSKTLSRIEPHNGVPLSILQPKAKDGATCLGNIRFAWEELAGTEQGMHHGPIQLLKLRTPLPSHEPFDIALKIQAGDDLLQPVLVYDEELFDRDTVERMSGHWLCLLEEIATYPAQTLGELNMMPAEERSLVLSSYAGGNAEYPQCCLHELFAQHVASNPDAEAVVFETDRLTYRQLDAKSNQVAQYLRTQGVSHGDRVGIFMDRSADMIVSMLGILKAGGAYVPIDPDYPAERLKFIAEDTALSCVLTARRVQAVLPTTAPLTFIDDLDSPVRNCSTEPVSHQSTPESIAVVIYTSGSTGQPKAACVPHRAAVRTVHSTNYVSVTSEDRVAQVASPSFDAAIMEIWLALTNGATLIGMRRETLLGPPELRQLIRREGITVMVLNTAYLHQISRDAPDALKGLRKILFGGEAAEPGPMRTLLKHLAPGVLVNGYGPAEGCVITTYYEIHSVLENALTIPIGRPVTNAQIYLLDQRGQPVPIGVQGEIYVGGEGVASGYWNRPELTALRFIPDMFLGRANRPLYRTGDLARMRSNGELEFRGRADEQVKIRGHRIELAEVQHAITMHPAVKQVFLMVREDQPGDKRLVAYVSLNGPLPSPQEALRQHAKQKLPSHMLPAAFLIVDSIPLNTNGKVDRKALPAPQDRPQLASEYLEAQSELECLLTKAWQELLRVAHVGIDDNFFDLGGHSLLAARLIARIEEETGQNIPVATLFEAPTIARLAEKLRLRSYANAWSPLVELHAPEQKTAAQPFFCVHSLGANLVSFHKIASLLRGDRPIYGLQPHGLDGQQQPLETIEAMAAAYLTEIQKKQPHGPYYVGGICIGGVLAYEIAQQLRATGEEVALVALIDSFVPGKLRYQHSRLSLIEYLDGHLGEMLRLPALKAVQYFCKWAANGGVLLSRALGWRDNSSLGRATRRVAETHTRATVMYQPKPYEGRIVQFMCSDGPHRSYEDRRLAWSALVPGGFEVRIVPGNHLSMVEEPHVRVLAHEVQNSLDRASGVITDRTRKHFSTEESDGLNRYASWNNHRGVGEFSALPLST